MSTRGCPYWKFNTTTLREKCKLTGEDVEDRVECDFGFEACPHYQKARSKRKERAQGSKHRSSVLSQQVAPSKSAGNYQQDMFGGEIEFSKLNEYQTVNPVDK